MREYWAEMARAVCMEIYRSENDRVERLGKRGFFIGVTYASPRSSFSSQQRYAWQIIGIGVIAPKGVQEGS